MAQSLPIRHFITFLFTVNVIRHVAALFSKVDSNRLWLDVQNEEAVICAKFGKDLFNISKVIGRKTKWSWFFGLPGIYFHKRYKDIVSMLDCWIPSLLLTIEAYDICTSFLRLLVHSTNDLPVSFTHSISILTSGV